MINYCDELLAAPDIPPQSYWANTSGNDLILRLLEKADQTTKDEVEDLLNGGKITKRVRQVLTCRDIGVSRLEFMNQPEQADDWQRIIY